ncbi:MAG TPA: SDR family NAD-dependent epimerase/dehydratase, partial [Burkholderiales bacterium]|nr:SDR family NAD-dependent epimerase/dehydratase [Burkholderiales bacterium]
KIIDLCGSGSRVVYKPLPVNDPVQRQPDVTLARRHIRWNPQVDLEQGLRQTIAYFDELLRREQRSAALHGSLANARRIGGTAHDAPLSAASGSARPV